MSTVIWSSRPKARKQHVCENCGRVIDRGEVYKRLRALDEDGDPYTWKECAHCSAFVTLYIDDFADRYEGFCQDDIREWEPYTDEAAEHKRQWMNKWHNDDGDLYPIPAGTTDVRDVEVRQPREAYL